MQIDINFISGLVFGLDADSCHQVDDNGQLTGVKAPAITLYLGIISITLIFA